MPKTCDLAQRNPTRQSITINKTRSRNIKSHKTKFLKSQKYIVIMENVNVNSSRLGKDRNKNYQKLEQGKTLQILQILQLFVYPILYIRQMSSYRNIIVNSKGTIRLQLELSVNRFVRIMSVKYTFDQILFHNDMQKSLPRQKDYSVSIVPYFQMTNKIGEG